MDDLVSREYDQVSLRSIYVAELVHQAVEEAQNATRRATEAAAKAIEATQTGDERTSAFIAWAAKHRVNVNERGNEVTLQLGELPADEHRKENHRLLHEGLDLWEQANRDPAKYQGGRYRYHYQEREHSLRSLDVDTVTQPVVGRVWETLR